jgi:hypothetical protein
MAPPSPSDAADLDQRDQVALRMMLSYVEAECLRLGATAAARHAALAAAAMPGSGPPSLRSPNPRRSFERLH